MISVMILALEVGGCGSSGNHDISGTVTDSGSGLKGVTLTLSTGDTSTSLRRHHHDHGFIRKVQVFQPRGRVLYHYAVA